MTPHKMVAALLDPDFEDEGTLANDLLSAFWRGFPIENLKPLLVSEYNEARSAAAFIATELDWKPHSLVHEIAGLLDHPSSLTRYSAIQALMQCTRRENESVLGRALLHLDDEHVAPRYAAMDLIRFGEQWQVFAARRHAAKLIPDSEFAKFWDEGKLRDYPPYLDALLAHDDRMLRLYGTAIALRPRLVVDERRVSIIEKSDIPEAQETLRRMDNVLTPIDAVWSSTFKRTRGSSSSKKLH